MKKPALLTILLFILFLNSGSFSLASEEKTFLYDYEGNVVLLRNGQGLTLKSDIPIAQYDVLKTDTNATADIIVNQLAGIHFYGESECLFTDIHTSSVHLNLSQGFTLCSIKAMPSTGTFSLETPTAIVVSDVLARYLCKIEGEGAKTKTTVAVIKGKLRVKIKSSAAMIDVLAGQGLDVTNESFITPPRDLTEEETKILFKTTAIVTSDEAAE